MAVGLPPLSALHPVPGIRLGTACAGIKKPGRRDLVIIELCEQTTCTAVFTQNSFCAAPVTLARAHLQQTAPRYLLINTGNANAGTGAQGLEDARLCCEAVAKLTHCAVNQILPFSTGVIGEALPVATLQNAVPAAYTALAATGWEDAAHGIMTTDTVAKGVSRQIMLAGETITVTGIAKGSGMIRPDMATMLAFIATDAGLSPALTRACLNHALPRSFNRITVDGDTSTNDACVLLATGQSGLSIHDSADPAYAVLRDTMAEVCAELAQAIVRDGEGATKFITVHITGGANAQECLAVAYSIAHSPLVKTAFFASDPNWGRILAAIGRADTDKLQIERITIHLDEICIVHQGSRAADYQEAAGRTVMARPEITIRADLGRGAHSTTVWTCDFSYDYVRINAEYRT